MASTAEIIESFERCQRIPAWTKQWEKHSVKPIDILYDALGIALTDKRTDVGANAGESVVEVYSRRKIDTDALDVYSQAMHYASLADIIACSLRKPSDEPWMLPESTMLRGGSSWESDAFLDPSGTHLRRISLVSGWSQDRHYAECRSWRSLGEICAIGLPMQLIVCVLGQSKKGKRYSYWSHGLQHPVNKKLRFRKKHGLDQGFKDTWRECWREDHDEIDTQTWLNAMVEDDVIRDVLFKIDIPLPEKPARQKIIDLAARKLERIEKLKALPDRNLSSCDWPSPCQFRRVCDANEEPSGRYGFVRIS